MSAVSTFLTTANPTPNDQVGEWYEEIRVRQGRSANMNSPLLGICSRLKAEKANSYFFNWFERDPARRNFYILNAGSAYTATTTTLAISDSAGNTANAIWPILNVNSVLLNTATGEYISLTQRPTTNSIVVQRNQYDKLGLGLGTGTAAGVANGQLWSLITLPRDEGGLPPRAVFEQPETLTNYVQTFGSSVFLSNYYNAGELRTDMDGPLEQNKVYALETICNDIEFSYMVGQKNAGVDPETGRNLYTTGGIKGAVDAAIAADSSLAGNVLNCAATGNACTLKAFKQWLQGWLINGTETKLLFCGPLSFSALSDYANSGANGFRIMNNDGEVFGMKLYDVVTPLGSVSMAMHPLMKNSLGFNDWMIGVDLNLITQKVMEKLFYQDGIETPGQAAYQGQFRAMLALKLEFAAAFGYATGLRSITG